MWALSQDELDWTLIRDALGMFEKRSHHHLVSGRTIQAPTDSLAGMAQPEIQADGPLRVDPPERDMRGR